MINVQGVNLRGIPVLIEHERSIQPHVYKPLSRPVNTIHRSHEDRRTKAVKSVKLLTPLAEHGVDAL